MASLRIFLTLALLVGLLKAQQVVNGQIFTPGIAIVDAPQPNTPVGGHNLQIALDVTSNGQLSLPPYPQNYASGIHNITIFLSSYVTGWNLTITNGTATEYRGYTPSLGDIMLQEAGSTVKHVGWGWPSCMVGNGPPTKLHPNRGLYNISIHQNFRLNGTEQYTIFNLPILVTNLIHESENRSTCESLSNPLLSEEELSASASNFTRVPGSAIAITGGADSLSILRTGALCAWIAVLGLCVGL